MRVRAYAPASAVNYKSANSARYAERQRWQIAEICEDVSSDAKASCPALNRLIADAEARKIDCLPVWKLDRFGGSLVERQDPGEEQHPVHRGHPKGWIRTSRIRRCGSCCMCWVPAAESEPAPIRERAQAGQARYKQDFRERQGGQDCLEPVPAEPATPPSQESVRPGRGTPVAAPRLVISTN